MIYDKVVYLRYHPLLCFAAPKPKAEAKPKAKPKPDAAPKPEAKPQAEAAPKSKARAFLRVEALPEGSGRAGWVGEGRRHLGGGGPPGQLVQPP